MTTPKIFYYLIAFAIILQSCSVNSLETTQVLTGNDGFAIPIETALSTLEKFMQDDGIISTKGCVNDCIDNYFVFHGTTTKGTSTNGDVMYVVNFKDNGGYALLAADTRIPDEILAITDSGNVAECDYCGPETVMQATDNDDLTIEEYNSMVASGVLAAARDKQIAEFCHEYAMNSIDNSDRNIMNGDMGTTQHEDYDWIIVERVPRMLETIWTQDNEPYNDIFNKYCPEVGLVFKHKAPAGCVCIALSQIIAYHEYPDRIYDGLPIDYDAIKMIYSYFYGKGPINDNNNDSVKDMLAKFCITIGGMCKTKYHSIFGKDWGFAWPIDAAECLSTLGYENVVLNDCYDENLVIESLKNDCPVFIAAVAGLWSGHAWVIDGYIKRNYSSSKGTILQSQTLVHCNWGWAGKSNGYFASGMFNADEAIISDGISSETAHDHYWYGFRTISYDNPNE